ncbi:MAG: hypothetical protein V3U34_07860 [candidate division NC10 bacterium]
MSKLCLDLPPLGRRFQPLHQSHAPRDHRAVEFAVTFGGTPMLNIICWEPTRNRDNLINILLTINALVQP